MPERECPSCQRPLTGGRLGPVSLDLCLPCGGVWFDHGELSRVIAAGPHIVRRLAQRLTPTATSDPSHTDPLRRAPVCPGCHVGLAHVEYASMPGVSLDACRFCEGFWLTQPALLRLVAALEGASAWTPLQHPGAAPVPSPVSPVHLPAAPPAPVPPASIPAPPPQSSPPAQPPPPWAGAPSAAVHGGAPIPAAGNTGRPAEQIRPTSRGETCLHCGEVNAERAAVCWACGRQFQGQVVGACPHCQALMRRIDSAGVTLSGCEGCGGVCMTPNRLNQLLLQTEEQQTDLLKQVDRFRTERMMQVRAHPECPHCHIRLIPSQLGMLTPEPVSACPQCSGLFLEHGRLHDILLGQRR